MKQLLPLLIFLCGWMTSVRAQEKADIVYYYDADWKLSKQKNAMYLVHILSMDDSCRQVRYYNNLGPCMRVESYRDKALKVRHGVFAWYNTGGQLDSCGAYYEGLPDKTWIYPDAMGKIGKIKVYDKGQLKQNLDPSQKAPATGLPDAANPPAVKVEIESAFPGGLQGWGGYLRKNFHYPDRAVDHKIQGEVRVFFIVDTLGRVREPQLLRSVEYSIDDSSLWILQNSPDWIPALQNGHKVKSFKTQPIVFRLRPA